MSGLRGKDFEVQEVYDGNYLPGLWIARSAGQPSCLWLLPGILSAVPHCFDGRDSDLPTLWELYEEPDTRKR